MALRLSTKDAGFEARFAAFLTAKRAAESEVEGAAAEIIAAVRAEGDAAVVRLTAAHDRVELRPGAVAMTRDAVAEAAEQTPPEAREALELSAARIDAYHQRQIPQDARWTDGDGVDLGWRWSPVEAAGVYAPGGLASYPSSVLMNAIPARVAGVRRLALCAPAPDGQLNPLVMYAAQLAEIDEVYPIGGAQAIAALAYGTESLAPVDLIVGPGNAYVTAAKRRVVGDVRIDGVAGPSEVLILADASADPDWIAVDLLAQAEHDPAAQAVLATDSAALADAVAAAVDARLQSLPRAEIAGAAWRDFGAIILARDLFEAAALADRIAPEHLQICAADEEMIAASVRHAGAIFLGAGTPEALGDYVAGPSHVLPTSGSARRASGLSVMDFMKRTSITRVPDQALRRIGPAAEILAAAEGFEAHRLSVALRLAAPAAAAEDAAPAAPSPTAAP